jgi:hypothetical protein
MQQMVGARMEACVSKSGWPVQRVSGWEGEVGETVRVPFLCKRWRCPDCRKLAANRSYARCCRALKRHPQSDLVFIVLTQRRPESPGVAALYSAFDGMRKKFTTWKRWLDRNYGSEGYFATVEITTKGWPHMNVVLVSKTLAAAVRQKQGRWSTVNELRGAAMRAGFGHQLTAEVPRDARQVVSYALKMAGSLEGLAKGAVVGEATKRSQLPVNAPPNFRRERSSQGFLPPDDDSGFTGRLVKEGLKPAELRAWEEEQKAHAENKAKKKRAVKLLRHAAKQAKSKRREAA